MFYLLDTCTISELVAPQPNQSVLEWFKSQSPQALYLSIITLGEIQTGVYALPPGKRRLQIETFLFDTMLPMFHGRIFNIDEKLIAAWAKMTAELKAKGLPRSAFDSLIEATALHHNLVLVTRNTRNFKASKASILNIWLLKL